MLGGQFSRYLKPVPPRNLPRLNLFLNFIDGKVKDATQRASYITPNGYGSRLLVEIIKLANLDDLLNSTQTGRSVGVALLGIVAELEKFIDVRNGKHTTNSLFIISRLPCYELITPSRRGQSVEAIWDIPFDLPYAHPKWLSIKPLRVSDMGTTDLKFNIHTDYFHYTNHGPTHAIYSLDCIALVAKFLAYYRFKSPVVDLDQCLLDFVHNEVIVPSLLNDTLAIWLRNMYRQQLISYSRLESLTATIWDNITIDTIGSDFTAGMIDVYHLKDDLRKQSVSPQTVLSSLLLTTDKLSFSEYYLDLFTTTTVPNRQQYIWVDCLKNLSWWETIVTIASFTPSQPDTIAFQRNLARDVRLWLMMKPWTEIHSSIPFKTMIRNRLEGLSTYLNKI